MHQDRILGWAAISGDYNRLHVDPEYAKNTLFKGTIAHGPMSLAFLNELLMAGFGAEWVVSGRLLDVRFLAPIRPGDRIRIGGTVKRVYEERGAPYVECDVFIDKADGGHAVTGRSICRAMGEKK
jgi:3-hydroxybutyryl-CoA dehydratase